MPKVTLFTYQNAVKSRRGSSPLHMSQNGHACVKTQIFDHKLGGYKEKVSSVYRALSFLSLAILLTK